MFGAQVIVVQLLPEAAVWAAHDATAVGPVFTVLHVVELPMFPAFALAVDGETAVGPVGFVARVVVVYALPEFAVAGLQLPTGVGPVATVLQVVVV